MKKQIIISATALSVAFLFPPQWGGSGWGFSQNISINTTGTVAHTSALLEVGEAANLIAGGDTKGLLCPHVALTGITDVATIATPANGLIVYNTNAAMTNGNGVGLYFYCSSGCATTGWKFMSAADNGPGTAGQVLTSQGAGAQELWTTPVATTGGGGGTGCAACITTTAIGTTGTWSVCRNSCVAMGAGWRMPTWDEEVYIGSGALGTPAGGWIAAYVWTSTPTDARVYGTLNSLIWMVLNESFGAWLTNNYGISNSCRCFK